MTEREKIIRFFADIHGITCAKDDLERRFEVLPIDYKKEGWIQVRFGEKILGELSGNHPRIFFSP